MKLPLTLPLANHFPRKIALYDRIDLAGMPPVAVVVIEVLSDLELAALRRWLPIVTVQS